MVSGILLRRMQRQRFVLLCVVIQGSWCLSLYRYKTLMDRVVRNIWILILPSHDIYAIYAENL